MKINEITGNNDIDMLSESIDDELRALVKQQVADPLNNLTANVAKKLKVWALEIYHALNKGADSEKVSLRTLKAIINDPMRFAQQLITHEVNKRGQNENQ